LVITLEIANAELQVAELQVAIFGSDVDSKVAIDGNSII
jgi:hypothetical protein